MDRSSSNIVVVDCNANTKITCYQNRHDSRNVSHCVIIFTRNWRWTIPLPYKSKSRSEDNLIIVINEEDKVNPTRCPSPYLSIGHSLETQPETRFTSACFAMAASFGSYSTPYFGWWTFARYDAAMDLPWLT